MPKNLFALELKAIALSGPDGQAWVEAFRSSPDWRRLDAIFSAVRRLRGYGMDSASAALDEVGAELDGAREAGAGRHLTRRWYLSARAYGRYLDGNLDAAELLMDEARDEAICALSRHPFLVPFATQFTDFDIQKARIYRQRNRWSAVRRYLARVRRAFIGEEPLCILRDGSALTMEDVRAFYADALPEDEGKQELLANLGHPAAMDRLEQDLYTLPDFVIPYP